MQCALTATAAARSAQTQIEFGTDSAREYNRPRGNDNAIPFTGRSTRAAGLTQVHAKVSTVYVATSEVTLSRVAVTAAPLRGCSRNASQQIECVNDIEIVVLNRCDLLRFASC